jgi:hypothetical protein
MTGLIRRRDQMGGCATSRERRNLFSDKTDDGTASDLGIQVLHEHF